jgi:hypothetical protein
MKLSHFASAAASVLVLSIAAPAFAQTGYLSGMYGENRDHPNHRNTEEIDAIGGFSVPVGMLEFSGEASYLDTGRDTVVIDPTLSRNGDTEFDVQTLFAGSVYMRNDKMAYGATVAGGELGDIVFDVFDPTVKSNSSHAGRSINPNQAKFATDKITELEGSFFAQMYADKWVGSARVGFGDIQAGTLIATNPSCTSCAAPSSSNGFLGGTDRLRNVDNHLNYVDVTLDGNFFFTDNAQLTLGVDWKDLEQFDPVVSSSIGLEWQPKSLPVSLKSQIEFSKWGNSIMLGLVGTFGAETINDRVRKGPANPFISALRQYSSQFITGGF